MEKPEALTTSGQTGVQDEKFHDARYIQPSRDGQLAPAESGQGYLFLQALFI